MKKNKLALALLSLTPIALTTSAIASTSPTLRLEMRGELLAVQDDAGDPINFKIPYLRVDLRGKVDDKLSYRAKFRLNASYSSSNADGLPGAVDYAYIDYRFNDTLKLRAGKQYAALGGWESDYSSIDVYGRGSEIWNVSSRLFYRTGVALHVSPGNHFINIQILNNSFGDETGGTYNNGYFYGAQYRISLMDGALTPIFSLHRDERSDENSDGVERDQAGAKTDAAAGIQYNKDGLKIEADILASIDEGVVDGADGREVNAFVTRVSKRIGATNIIGKYARSDVKFDNEDTNSIDAFEVAVEYFPVSYKNFRVFGAIAHDRDKPEAGDTADRTELKIGFIGTY